MDYYSMIDLNLPDGDDVRRHYQEVIRPWLESHGVDCLAADSSRIVHGRICLKGLTQTSWDSIRSKPADLPAGIVAMVASPRLGWPYQLTGPEWDRVHEEARLPYTWTKQKDGSYQNGLGEKLPEGAARLMQLAEDYAMCVLAARENGQSIPPAPPGITIAHIL